MYAELKEVWNAFTGPGGPFEVTEIDVRGIPTKIYKNAAPSLRDVWLGSAGHAENDYLVYEDERWTYARAHDEVGRVAAWLAQAGVAPGDRVAISMRNYPEWMLAYWATVSMGATAVGMNAWWTTDEMQYGLEDSRPTVLVCDDERLERLAPILPKLDDMTVVAVRSRGALSSGVVDWRELTTFDGQMPEVEIDPDSDACIFYTSGTTGRPKGAQLTHRGCTNNLMSLVFINLAVAAATAKSAQKSGKAPAPAAASGAGQMTQLVCTPLFHVTANNCVAQTSTMAGAKMVLMYKWDAAEALKLIEREQVTNLTGVPVMSRELLAHPDFEKTDTSSLKALGGGGAPVQPDLVDKIEKASKGARPSTGYGMTETCGIITANAADFFVDKPASAGPAMPVFDVKCIDAEGNDLPTGEVGELCVRGAQVIRGYLNRPEATAEAIVDGWLRTGDVARIDEDGFIFIVDRAKDMVLRGGENVYCAEVENVLHDVEGVAECAVFGVPDPRLGEEVGAALVAREGAALDAEAIRAVCAAKLAKYKIPRYLWILDAPLPRNASGKFLKRQLREELDVADAV